MTTTDRASRPARSTKTLGTLSDVPALGLGCMGMSGMYGPSDRAESIATIRAALAAGIAFLDTADFYGTGHNELLLAEALRGVPRDDVLLSVKYGVRRGPDGSWLGVDAGPAATKNALAHTLTRLATDHVDVYRPARLDPLVPIEETVGAIAQLVAAGYVRHIGLSEVGAETIRRAHAVHPISDVQIEYSLVTRVVEGPILATCRELGIGITAYGVLSRGLISGHWSADRVRDAGDFRSRSPRFGGENLTTNLALVEALRGVAARLGVSVAQAAIAWVGSRGSDVLPLVGARTRERLEEALGAWDLDLGADALAEIEAVMPPDEVAGGRYDAAQLAQLDSEQGA